MKLISKVARTRNVDRSQARESFDKLAAAVARGEREFIAVSKAGVLYDHKEKQFGVITELLKPVYRRNKEGENLPKEQREEPATWEAMKGRINSFLQAYDKGMHTCGDYTVELADGKTVDMYVIQPGPNTTK